MKKQMRKILTRKNMILMALISLGLTAAISIETHKNTLFFPGFLTEKSKHNEEKGGFVSHAEFEQDCGHCHGPIHCVEDRRCQECHQEVALERANSLGLHGQLPGIRQCENCHSEHKGRQARITLFAYNNVDHELLSGFSLDLHQFDYDDKPMGCQSCHSQDSFISERLDCINCHSNGDHDFTAAHIDLFGTDCVSCHDGNGHYANFQHVEVYTLDGEHENLECPDCHLEKQFAGTPQECSSCHEEPAVHAGIFGQECNRCHIPTAWYPAELTYHSFIVDHGKEGAPTCDTCHTHTYTEYRCESCHETIDMEIKHMFQGIFGIEGCIECHPSGNKEDTLEILDQKSEVDNPVLVLSGVYLNEWRTDFQENASSTSGGT